MILLDDHVLLKLKQTYVDTKMLMNGFERHTIDPNKTEMDSCSISSNIVKYTQIHNLQTVNDIKLQLISKKRKSLQKPENDEYIQQK